MFHWKIQVYYEDTDAGGIVYYANYLKFMERARTEWLRNLGYEQDRLCKENDLIFVVKSAQIDYFKPAYFNDTLEVHTQLADAGKVHLDFMQEITRDTNLLTSATITIVCLNQHSFKPSVIPTTLLEEMHDAK